MWPRRPQPPKPAPPPEPKLGFFGSGARPHFADRTALAQIVAEQTFQKGVELTASEGIAMDDYSVGPAGQGQGGFIKAGFNSFGNNISEAQLAWYASQSFIGFQTCALLMQHWFIRKACFMPAEDAVRNGWDITVNNGVDVDPAVLDKVRQRDKFYKIKDHAVEFIGMKRGFGIRVALPVVDGLDYTLPYNPDGVKPGSYKGITQIDPYWINPMLDLASNSDPASIGFYEPTWWMIRGQRVHKSHLIIARNGKLPDLLKPTYLYGGVSLPQMLVERVYAAERTANEAPLLALSKRATVIHLDTAAALANQNLFVQKMQQWMAWLNNFSVKVVGTEEKIEQFDTSLSDLDKVIGQQYGFGCAIAEVPITKMMGQAAAGLNATGEGDEANYHELLESLQEHDAVPLMERHYELLIRSEFAGKFDVTVRFTELDAMTTMEQAQVNKIVADTDAVLAQTGAIDGQDIRDRIIKDPSSGYNGLSAQAPLPDDDEDLAEAISKDSAEDAQPA